MAIVVTYTFEWAIEVGKAQITLSLRSEGPVSKEQVIKAVEEKLEELYGPKQ